MNGRDMEAVKKWATKAWEKYDVAGHERLMREEEWYRQKCEDAGEDRINELLQENLASRIEWMTDMAKRIEDRGDALCSHLYHGTFHPSNTYSRGLFSTLTGLPLPSTVSGTKGIIEGYLGSTWTRWIEARKAAKKAAADEKRAKRAAKERARIESILSDIAAGDPIDGHDLVDAARHVGVDIPLRTRGSFIRRVYNVRMGGYSDNKRGFFKVGPCHYYGLVRAVIAEKELVHA